MKERSHEELPDEALAALVQSGDPSLWPALAARVLAMMAPIVARRVQQADREDVAQDALVRFYLAMPSYTPARGALRAFVSILTRRQVADYYRRRNTDPDTADIEDLADIIDEGAAVYANPGVLPELEEVAGERAWRVIQKRLDGYSWAEVAAELALTEGQAKMRMKRALGKMRRYLEDVDGQA